MLFISRMLKDLLNCWQLLRQDSLKLLLPAFPFAYKYAGISKVIYNKVIWTQVQIFVPSDTNNAGEIIQAWRDFAPGILALIYRFSAARARIMGNHTNWLLNIRQRNIKDATNACQIGMCCRRSFTAGGQIIRIVLNMGLAFLQCFTSVCRFAVFRKL